MYTALFIRKKKSFLKLSLTASVSQIGINSSHEKVNPTVIISLLALFFFRHLSPTRSEKTAEIL